MKIKAVKWKNHPILGNLELDFFNIVTKKPYDTIIFAGENGVGKTTILETISAFLNIGSFEFFEEMEYIVESGIYKAVQQDSKAQLTDFFHILDSEGNRHAINSNRNNQPDTIDSNLLDPRRYGCIFSKARADYKTSKINYATTKELDINKYDNDEEDDFTALKQLLVDVNNQDNSDYAEVNKKLGTNPQTWQDFYSKSKIFRFKNAFDSFFKNLTYEKVIDQENEKLIIFKKNGKNIPIDKLSTGEKQIVFRGVYLLRNNQQLKNSSIMIDEPELSMHPKWQENVLQYYKNLFSDNDKQTAQLFISTHSEYIIKHALKDQANTLVIVLKDNNGTIISQSITTPSTLPTITHAETNYLAFNVPTTDYHIELYGYLQEKEKILTVKSCDDFIRNHPYFDQLIHSKDSSFGSKTYHTLSTYIRNAIDHPHPDKVFTDQELRTSIELLIKLCQNNTSTVAVT